MCRRRGGGRDLRPQSSEHGIGGGLTYCLIGGRSLGIDTTMIDPAQWMKQFGIDVDHVNQFELVRRAGIELAGGSRVTPAFDYFGKTIGCIHWTPPDAQFHLTHAAMGPAAAVSIASSSEVRSKES